MTTENQQIKYYTIIGEFVSKVNTFEFIVNVMLEQIVGTYSENSTNKDLLNDTIDFIQEQSLRIRINQIILLITMNNQANAELEDAVESLKGFSKYYNKSIRNVRDFIAHNPFLEGETLKIVSSRRYQGKLNSMTLTDIEEHTKALIPKIKELFSTAEIIAKYYPVEVTRELN
ncbi:hypothetical protein [Runella zeae]|uniref:hypothetical protein n=1 Tax=Runella zeae TaxID=94255 RepID=UPI0023521C34|nr:hypothetical protein [Runella zeae]